MILVTGATGNVGRELTHELATAGMDVRILVRDQARADGLPDRAERFVGDFGDPGTLAPAFEGVDRLFLLTQGIGVDYAAAAIEAARSAGVRHIVFVSSYSVGTTPLPAMARWHNDREELIRASGIPFTILRPGGFMTNAFDWLATIRDAGYVIDAVGPGRLAPIDPADIASAAAHVLTTSAHEGKIYTLTGDEAFTVAEQVAILASAIGRDIEVRDAGTPDEIVRARFPNGAPPALAAAIIEGFNLMRSDTVGFRTDDLQRLLGRKPRTFADWCARHADTFRTAAATPRG